VAVIEANLTYRPAGLDSDEPISLGSTDDPTVLRALRDRLLLAAKQAYLEWAGVEPGIAALRRAEHQRLVSIFEVLLPDEDLEPALQLVGGGGSDGAVEGYWRHETLRGGVR
jgi:hypothetical protein